VHDAEDLEAFVGVLRVGLHHERELLPAGRTPGGPEVDEHGLPAQLRELHGLAIDGLQVDLWGRLAEERMSAHDQTVRGGTRLVRRRRPERHEEDEEQAEHGRPADADEGDQRRARPRLRHYPAAARAATAPA
jgi:hypothetical protein